MTRGLVVVGLSLLLASAGPTSAAVFSAASVADLIAAINSANQNAESDSIALAAGTTFALTLSNVSTNGPTGLPTITASESLSIVGNGSNIERSAAIDTPAFRMFDIAAEASLTLENVTLQGGSGLNFGGAIQNAGDLRLNSVILQNNRVVGRPGANCFRCGDRPPPRGGIGWPGEGGAIYSSGSLLLQNSTLNDNRADGGRGGTGPGGMGRGGDGRGGGLFVAAGTATLLHNVVINNLASRGDGVPFGQGYGGGIYIDTDAGAQLDQYTLTHVTSNTASTNHPNIYGEFDVIADPIPLPGDFNYDGAVDAADYVVWRRSNGTQSGYDTWRSHFGQAAGGGAAGYALGASAEPLPAAVPEPATLALLMITISKLFCGFLTRRDHAIVL
jgi:hypothetical protein